MIKLGGPILAAAFVMRKILSSLDRCFIRIDGRSREVISNLSKDTLYQKPRESRHQLAPFSCGEYILRSAAMVERSFGGITTRLWDDPFEWTLPEKLSDKTSVIGYLDEVEATRKIGFAYFASDEDLRREIPAPVTLRPIIEILLETVGLAEHFQGRAFAIFQMLSDDPLPRL